MSAGPVDVAAGQNVVAGFKDPETGLSVANEGQSRDIQVAGSTVSLTLALPSFAAPIVGELQEKLSELIRTRLPQVSEVRITPAVHPRPPKRIGQVGITVKSVIAVGSGKGGVGKSTLASSIALGLKRAGAKVGLMDADVYGPSIPHLLGVEGRPNVSDDKKIIPLQADGMPVLSMGFLVPKEEAVVWRGPMLHGAVTQFLRDTEWGELDYLIIDMPPGTGDIALTLSQLLPLTGAVVVCTPQEVALLDAVKAIAMFRKVNIPVLGMIENMSGFICPDCNKRYDIFGSGGAKQKAEEMNVPFLGEVPLNMQIRVKGDAGQMMSNYDDPIVRPYLEKIVATLVRNLAQANVAKPPALQLPTLG